MSAITFGDLPWLAPLLLLVAAAEFWRRRRRVGRAAIALPWFAELASLPKSRRQQWVEWIAPARVALLTLLALCAAGPAVELRADRSERRGVDLELLLDVSSSMKITLPGSFAERRFDAARAAALEFVRGRQDDRVGLLTFARFPRLQCPLTWDHPLFEERLDAARPVVDGSDEDRTAIGTAVAEAARRFPGAADRARVVVLVTDGANNLGPIEPADAAQFCRSKEVRLYAISIGSGMRFGSGEPPRDLAALGAMADATGGRVFEAKDRADLDDAWREIDGLERTPIEVVAGVAAWPASSLLLAIALLAWLALRGVEQRWAKVTP